MTLCIPAPSVAGFEDTCIWLSPLSNSAMSWMDASTHCKNGGGDLPSFANDQEFTFVQSAMVHISNLYPGNQASIPTWDSTPYLISFCCICRHLQTSLDMVNRRLGVYPQFLTKYLPLREIQWWKGAFLDWYDSSWDRGHARSISRVDVFRWNRFSICPHKM